MARNPKIVQGLRGPQDARSTKEDPSNPKPTGDKRLERLNSGKTVFRTGRNLYVAKVKPGEVLTDRIGRPYIGKATLAIITYDRDYETDDPEIIAKLKSLADYGVAFWTLEDEVEKDRNEAVNAARAAYEELKRKSPEAAAALKDELVQLARTEFELGAQ